MVGIEFSGFLHVFCHFLNQSSGQDQSKKNAKLCNVFAIPSAMIKELCLCLVIVPFHVCKIYLYFSKLKKTTWGREGVPHSVLGWGWGYPILSWMGSSPIHCWVGGTSIPEWGVPLVPSLQTWDGVPSVQTWGTPAPVQTCEWQMGYPPVQTWKWGTPPPTSVDRLKILPSPILRMRAVIIRWRLNIEAGEYSIRPCNATSRIFQHIRGHQISLRQLLCFDLCHPKWGSTGTRPLPGPIFFVFMQLTRKSGQTIRSPLPLPHLTNLDPPLHTIRIKYNTIKIIADPGFPRGEGANPREGGPTYYLTNFSRKLNENFGPAGARPLCPP